MRLNDYDTNLNQNRKKLNGDQKIVILANGKTEMYMHLK